MSSGKNAGSPRILVVGSINLDLVANVPHLPKPGETIAGTCFSQFPGGKGANQAVAAARLGAKTSMIGRVGEDAFASLLRENLLCENVDISCVREVSGTSSGLALIQVDDSGQNSITIIAGANAHVAEEDLEHAEGLFESADALLLQLEIPLPTVLAAIRLAQRHRVLTILDPAPAPAAPLPEAAFAAEVFTPNQSEAELQAGHPVTNFEQARSAAMKFHARGARTVVIKLGEAGAFVSAPPDPAFQVPSIKVTPLDTTAAGDAFTAALAVALSEKKPLREAVHFACLTGALAVTRHGAQPAMPRREEVEQLLAKQRAPSD